MNAPQNQKKPYPQALNDSILESMRNLGSGVKQTLVKDVAQKTATNAINSLFGTLPPKGEMPVNQPIEFPRFNRPEARRFVRPTPEALKPENVAAEQAKVRQELQAVRSELKALAQSIQTLSSEVQKAINEAPVNPGVYHVNFFERLRSFLKIMRQQIEDSRSWLTLSTGRKKKMGYWGRYKKHGTQFGLSSERTVATQAG